MTAVSSLRSSTASRGSTAAPRPAATRPWTAAPVAASSTNRGSTPCVRSCSSTCSRVGACAINGNRPSSSHVTGRRRPARGAPAWSTATNESTQSGTASKWPSGSGVSANARSSSPRISAASSDRVPDVVQRHRSPIGTEERRDKTRKQVGRRADAESSNTLAVERRQVRLRCSHAGDQRVGMRQKDCRPGSARVASCRASDRSAACRSGPRAPRSGG